MGGFFFGPMGVFASQMRLCYKTILCVAMSRIQCMTIPVHYNYPVGICPRIVMKLVCTVTACRRLCGALEMFVLTA